MLSIPRRRNQGFSLVEMMIVVVLLVITSTVAIPSFVDMIRRNQVESQASELLNLLQYARGQAVTRRTSYEVLLTQDGSQWVARRVNSNGEPTERVLAVDAAVAINASALAGGSLVFRPNGSANQAATFISCKEGKVEDAYVVQVRNSGVAQLFPRGKQSLTENVASCTP